MTELGPRVSAVLRRFARARGEALRGIDAELEPFVQLAEDVLVRGGKRVRPAFCYWGWRGAGGEDCDEIVTAAASLEVLHACALVHDDVMDDSDLRRGRPSAHRRLAGLHAADGRPGDPAAFGRSAAILLGDLFLTWADDLLMASGLAPGALARAWPTYARMRAELVAGQYLDLTGRLLDADGRVAADPARVGRIARYKTAGYTVIRPLQLGALLAGAPPGLLDAYAAFGRPLGEAFQLRDDILGVFGDPAVTGKPAGEDLRDGRPNALLTLALRHADPPAAAALRALVAAPATPAALARARELIVASGALALAEERIAAHTARALAALDDRDLDSPVHDALARLATAATARAL
ncbi:Geranylgeranyl pyrophosphate synthase [Frankia canadensis]|uniref:Geranylgeranyl pyrophosphate synthase n=1 Tax=Frankia canadensis TaxID=1836972 RepID=A0A2I2KVV4_9ACTN|nr:polyprenyl synthetase family protein [Frankia canadensis]SNQ49785.1 Geranylgeranyl pyrophosphate synthase [Frankia canadensis]SOU57075.1 Geranylgeranyl pyrophosphate synthase [Frankia canadensis]